MKDCVFPLRKARLLTVFIFLATAFSNAILAPSVDGQVLALTPDNSPPLLGTGKAYLQNDVETVNPVDGSLSIRINVPLPKGRGLDLPFSIAYDSNSTQYLFGFENVIYAPTAGPKLAIPDPPAVYTIDYFEEFLNWQPQSDKLLKSGWSYTAPLVTNVKFHSYGQFRTGNSVPVYGIMDCPYYSSYTYSDSSGERHDLHLTHYDPLDAVSADSGSSAVIAQYCKPPNNMGYPLGIDAYVQAQMLPLNLTGILVQDLDGTTFRFPNLIPPQAGEGGVGDTQVGMPDQIVDRNGNRINVTDENAGKFIYTDTLGRNLLQSTGFGNDGDTLSVSGIQTPYKMHWGSTYFSGFHTGVQVITGNQNAIDNQQYCFGANDVTASSEPVLTSIQLPNGQSYSFQYDTAYGLVSQINYPNGKWVKYTWGINPLSSYIDYEHIKSSNFWLDPQEVPEAKSGPGCRANYDKWAIVARDVGISGSQTAVLHQEFKYSTAYNAVGYIASKATSITTTDLVTGQAFTTTYNYVENNNNEPVESSVVVTQGGSVLQSTSKSWYTNGYTPLLACEQTSRDNIFASMTAYSYVPGYNLVTRKSEYDSGSCPQSYDAPDPPIGGTPVRSSITAYADLPATLLFPTYGAILDRPSSTVVEDGSGNIASEVDYQYDETPVAGVSATQHDDNCYNATGLTPACANGTTYPGSPMPASASRGNVTSINQRCLHGCTDTKSTYTYDETGQLVSSTDACGNATCNDMSGTSHTTTYSYADNFSNGAPSGQTNGYLTAITSPSTVGVQHTQHYSYRYADGQLSSSTDENGQVTGYSYNDSLARLTATSYPDGGGTTISYVDGFPSSVTTTTISAPEPNAVHISVYDGMGHIVQTQLASDPSGTDYVDTTYNGMGMPSLVSNPHRSGSNPTDGLTSLTYDALGRKTLQTQPDGSTLRWSYSGNAVFSTDEAGHTWLRNYDALGRLGSVTDPNGVSTGYAYDLLGNLTSATQLGVAGETPRNHQFVYDSASRLLSATNPETGTIRYSYDANGNLLSKTDARGVTINYTYDGLNRLTQKSYSDGTRTQWYAYDGKDYVGNSSSGSFSINAIGHLTQTTDSIEVGSAFAYDTMGRLIHKEDCIGLGCSAVAEEYAAYDLAGNLTSLTYPDGRVVTQSWDGAGHLQNLIYSSWNGQSVGYPYLGKAVYWPNGSLDGMTYGNAVAAGYHRNSRLQIDQNSGGSFAGQTYFNKVYCYGPATSPINAALPGCDGLASANNGNLWEIKDAMNGANTQTFQYDSLNRITGASVGGVVQQYGIDSFGNMRLTSGGSFVAAFDPATNRISNLPCASVFTPYDAAGNQLCDTDAHGAFRSYAYDGEGRIAHITVSGSSTPFETYLYDASGGRVRKFGADGSFTEYLSFNGLSLAEHNVDGSWSDSIFANGQRIARSDTAANPVNASASTTFYLYDRLGSAVALADGNGNLLSTSQFLPFGEEQSSATTANHFKFTGKERDAESGLDYFGARYYGGSMGRFQSPDPSGMAFTSLSNPQSFNMYSYVQNNPLNAVDPDGLDCVYIGGGGTITGFNRGDCDNSTTEKANSGYYFDGTVNTIYTTTGDTSGQVVGIQGTTDDGNSLYQANPAGLSFGQPNSSVSTSGMDTTINTWGDYSQTTQFNHGTHPFRDNNPGDITAGPFTSRNGQIGTDGRFAVFPGAGSGRGALHTLLTGGAYFHLSINAAVAKYAPSMENNTAGYQQFLTNVLGVSGNTPLSSLSPAQFHKLEGAIASEEGFNARGNYSVSVTTNF